MNVFIGGHGVRRVGIALVRGPRLTSLGQRQHEHRTEPARQETDDTRTEIASLGLTDIVAEQTEPVLFMPGLGRRKGQQDLALLTRTATGKVAVDGRLGTLIGKVAAPATQDGRRWAGAGRRGLLASVHRGNLIGVESVVKMLFLGDMAGGLDLERAVLDVEMLGKTTTKTVQNRLGLSHPGDRAIDHDMGAHDGHP